MNKDNRAQNHDIEYKMHVLEIATTELQSLKISRDVYIKKGNIFFRTDRSIAEKRVQDQLKELKGAGTASSTS